MIRNEKKKGPEPFSITLLHNLILLTGISASPVFSRCICPVEFYDAMYKSGLYIEMRFRPRFSAQVFRNRTGIGRILRDLYIKMSLCVRFRTQVRLERLPPRNVSARTGPSAGPLQAKTPLKCSYRSIGGTGTSTRFRRFVDGDCIIS